MANNRARSEGLLAGIQDVVGDIFHSSKSLEDKTVDVVAAIIAIPLASFVYGLLAVFERLDRFKAPRQSIRP